MKVQIVYSSLSGKTKTLAEAIAKKIEKQYECTIHNIKDGEPIIDGDIVLFGYWVDKGGPVKPMQDFMGKIESKAVGVFCTLGYYADSSHALQSIETGVNILKEKNEIIGTYACNGALSDNIIQMFRARGNVPKQNEIRWEIMSSHPTKAECDLGAERFFERVQLFEKIKESGLEFKSIL